MLVVETTGLKELRLKYLEEVTEARSSGRVVVYVDESYVKSHVARRCWFRKGSRVRTFFWKSQRKGIFLGNLWEIAEHLREIWKMPGKSQGIILAMADFSAEHVN